MKPSVDVVIPCYRYGRFLRECLESVLSQEGCDVRVLVIDDASTDDSADVARQLAAEDDRVEVIVHSANRGHIATYNEGINWACGDYFLLLSADDLLTPGALARAVALMEQHPEISFTHGREIIIPPNLPPSDCCAQQESPQWHISAGSVFIEQLCSRATNTIGTATVVVRTSAQKNAGHYRSDLPHAGDLEMWLRLAMLGNVANTSHFQGMRRVHGSNMSAFYNRVYTRDLDSTRRSI